jgi:hypothetical protein
VPEPISAWGRVALELLQSTVGELTVAPEREVWLWEQGRPWIKELAERKIDSLLYLACNLRTPAQRVYDKVWGRQRDTLLEALRALDSNGIGAVVFKSSEFFADYFDQHSLGILVDVDLLVEIGQLPTLKRILLSSGFRQAHFDVSKRQLIDTDLVQVARHESEHYELYPFTCMREITLDEEERAFVQTRTGQPLWAIEGECFLMVEIDVHRRVVADVDSSELFDRAIPSALGSGMTLSPTDHLWLTMSRYYNEVALHGKCSLREFACLGILMRRAEIDWDLLLKVVREYEIHSSLYYFLSFSNHLFAGLVPDEVLTEMLPLKGRRNRDWGWQIGKLFGGIEPFCL